MVGFFAIRTCCANSAMPLACPPGVSRTSTTRATAGSSCAAAKSRASSCSEVAPL